MSLFHVYKHKVDNACWGWQGSSVSMDFGGHMDGLYISTMGPAQCHIPTLVQSRASLAGNCCYRDPEARPSTSVLNITHCPHPHKCYYFIF